MAKYARNVAGCWVDVWTVPGDFPDEQTLEKCLPGDPFVIVDDAVVDGDFVVGASGYSARPAPNIPPKPRILSVTEFNKFGWKTLGMAAFQKILEDVRNSAGTTDADYEARAAVQQYDVAVSFAKSEVAAIGAKIMAAAFMTQDQFDAITGDNWPNA